MRDADLGYTDPQGARSSARARDYLGRVRGVVSDAGRVVVTSGCCQGPRWCARRSRPWARGGSRSRTLATTRPGRPRGAGLKLVPVPVDADGLRVDALERTRPRRCC